MSRTFPQLHQQITSSSDFIKAKRDAVTYKTTSLNRYSKEYQDYDNNFVVSRDQSGCLISSRSYQDYLSISKGKHYINPILSGASAGKYQSWMGSFLTFNQIDVSNSAPAVQELSYNHLSGTFLDASGVNKLPFPPTTIEDDPSDRSLSSYPGYIEDPKLQYFYEKCKSTDNDLPRYITNFSELKPRERASNEYWRAVAGQNMTGFSYPSKPSLDLRQLTDLTSAPYAPISSINDPKNAEEQRKRYCGGDELPSLYLRSVPPSINFTAATGVTGILSDPLIFQKVDTIDNVANFSSDQKVSWSISGTNSNLFTISSAGLLNVNGPNPISASSNSNYSVIVTATNEAGNSTSKSIIIKITATATPSNIIMIPNTDATIQIIPVDGANLNLNDYTFASTFTPTSWLSISSSGLISVARSLSNPVSGIWRDWPYEPYFQESGGISANITNTSTGQTLSKSYNVTIQAPLGSVSAPFSDLKMQKNVSLPTTSPNILGRVEYAGSTNLGYVQFQIIRSWFIHNGTGGITNGGYVATPGNGPVELDADLSGPNPPKSWFWICTGDSNGNNTGQGTANIATNDPGEAGASWRFDVGILYWCDLPLYESDGTTIRPEWTQGFNGGQGNYCIAGVNPYA